MFKLIRRFNYRSELRVNVLQVLVLFPGGYKSLKRAYPGVNDAIADHAKQETPIFQAAVMISVAVLADLASKLPEDAQPQTIKQLRELDYKRFGKDLADHLRSQRTVFSFQDGITVGTLVFAAALSIADLWTRNRHISPDDFQLITSEIIGALQGLSLEERSD